MPRTVPIVVTASDGTEMVFPSCKAAGQFLGVPAGRVSQRCVIGNTIHGFQVRYESKNKMGQVMEEE